MIDFSKKKRIEEMFAKWCETNKAEQSAISMITFMQTHGWLNEERILRKLESLDEIKIGDLVRVKDWGHAYTTNSAWVSTYVSDPVLIAQYAYGDDRDYKERQFSDTRAFEVIAIAKHKAFIATRYSFGGSGACYLVDLCALEKVREA